MYLKKPQNEKIDTMTIFHYKNKNKFNKLEELEIMKTSIFSNMLMSFQIENT